MARAKTKAKKQPTKTTTRAPSKPARALLDAKQKQKLLKPPGDWLDLAFKAVTAWKSHTNLVRVKGGSPAKLGSRLRAVKSAQKKLDIASRKAALANDAALQANDAAWRLVLAAYGMAQAASKTAPEVLQSFRFLEQAFARAGATPAAAPPPAPPPTK